MDALRKELERKKRLLESDSRKPQKYSRKDHHKPSSSKENDEINNSSQLVDHTEKVNAKPPSSNYAESSQLENPIIENDISSTQKIDMKIRGPDDRIEDMSTSTSSSKSEISMQEGMPLSNLSNQDVISRLRSYKEPIRLFGETPKDQAARLKLIEDEVINGKRKPNVAEEDQKSQPIHHRQGTENLYNSRMLANLKPKTDPRQGIGGELVDPKLIKKDKKQLSLQIVTAIKLALAEWSEFLDERPEDVKSTPLGKQAKAIHDQCVVNLKPLFRSLKRVNLDSDVLLSVAHITHHMQMREYVKANDAYLRLSIGNAPWPIGVISVGIHERAADQKLHSENMAHILNDEISRKYIQSMKRILTFAQQKYPANDPTSMMG